MFLRKDDFTTHIRQEDLGQIIEEQDSLLFDAIAIAQKEMEDYLRHRYLVADIFRDIVPWTAAHTYSKGARVELKAMPFSATLPYKRNDYAEYKGTVYRCLMSHTGSPTSDGNYWQPFCEQGDLFTALANTSQKPHTEQWEKSDTRHALMKKYMVDISLYHLHCRISPRLIPEHRIKLYEQAVGHLKQLAKGNLDSDLPQKPISEGRTFRWGTSLERQGNGY